MINFLSYYSIFYFRSRVKQIDMMKSAMNKTGSQKRGQSDRIRMANVTLSIYSPAYNRQDSLIYRAIDDCSKDKSFGYANNEPCVLLKLNKVNSAPSRFANKMAQIHHKWDKKSTF